MEYGKWTKNLFLKELPEDVDIVERYIHDYNRFVSPGQNQYVRMNIFYNNTKTSVSEIECVINGFKKPRIQWLKKANSDAPSPVEMGFFTGSVRAMSESQDFEQTFKKMFKLKYLGLWWACPKSDTSWTKDAKKWALHYEMDRSDIDDGKHEDILAFFSKNSSLVDKNLFGTAMSIAPIFKPFLDDEMKMKINRHAKKQASIGSNINSITLGGTHIRNWCDEKMENTLHHDLMMIESIYEKKVITSITVGKPKNNTFKGRVFYAIIPNQKSKMTTFYFSRANSDEARSIARALPLFIRDHYKLDPLYFCGPDFLSECLAGEWDIKSRSFLTLEEKDEKNKFAHLIDTVTAEREIFISEHHQQAMAVEGDDVESVETRLTKGDKPPPAATSNVTYADDASTLTGDTRESKAKAYADKATKAVSLQYVNTIQQINETHEQKVANLEKRLAEALGNFGGGDNNNNQMETDTDSVEVLKVRHTDMNSTVDTDLSEEGEEYASDDEEKEDMDDLSEESADSDNFPIMESIRKRRRAREKELNKGKDRKTGYDDEQIPSPQKQKVSKVTPPKLKRKSLNKGSSPFAMAGRGNEL